MEQILLAENLCDTFPSLREFEKFRQIRWFHVCGKWSQSLLLMTEDGRLYGLGDNGTGILGLGHTNPVLEPTEVVSMRNVEIDTISTGWFHVMARTTDGQIYRWGGTQFGQCAKQKGIVQPCLLLQEKLFRSVRCGSSFNLALGQDGLVYSWGSNCYRQLGGGNTPSRSQPIPVKELRDKEIVSIECGGWHSLALTKCGQVYAWGLNDSGQLFRRILWKNKDKQHFVPLPSLVGTFKTNSFCAIAAGEGHSLLLTDEGHIFACGHNKYGQLGKRTENECVDFPVLLWMPSSQNDPFVWIWANKNFSWAATRSGRYFGWGQYNENVNYFKPERIHSSCKLIDSKQIYKKQEKREKKKKNKTKISDDKFKNYVKIIQ